MDAIISTGSFIYLIIWFVSCILFCLLFAREGKISRMDMVKLIITLVSLAVFCLWILYVEGVHRVTAILIRRTTRLLIIIRLICFLILLISFPPCSWLCVYLSQLNPMVLPIRRSVKE